MNDPVQLQTDTLVIDMVRIITLEQEVGLEGRKECKVAFALTKGQHLKIKDVMCEEAGNKICLDVVSLTHLLKYEVLFSLNNFFLRYEKGAI